MIKGNDWIQLSHSQKTEWIQTALSSMVAGGVLAADEKRNPEYYIENLDDFFTDPDNLNKLVAWEITAFTAFEN